VSRTRNLINNIYKIIKEIHDMKRNTKKTNYQSLSNSNHQSHENNSNPNNPHSSESAKYSDPVQEDSPLLLPLPAPLSTISTDRALISSKDDTSALSSCSWHQSLNSCQIDSASASDSTEMGEASEIREGMADEEEETGAEEEDSTNGTMGVGEPGMTRMDSEELEGKGVGFLGLTNPSKTPNDPSSEESLHPAIMGNRAAADPRKASSMGRI